MIRQDAYSSQNYHLPVCKMRWIFWRFISRDVLKYAQLKVLQDALPKLLLELLQDVLQDALRKALLDGIHHWIRFISREESHRTRYPTSCSRILRPVTLLLAAMSHYFLQPSSSASWSHVASCRVSTSGALPPCFKAYLSKKDLLFSKNADFSDTNFF